MRKQKSIVAASVVGALLITGGIATVAVGGFGGNSSPEAASTTSAPGVAKGTGSTRTATQIGKSFLADWVVDGRVVRKDQGDDTVSEGQAYGMLVAVGVGDEKSFQSIWSWTKKHLQRDDGLLGWRWDSGKIEDNQPASDADMDASRALVLAGKTFDDNSYTTAGTKLGGVILDKLTATTPDGRILLPGLWAASASGPWSYNPSYAAPATFQQMEKATKDPRWKELETGSRSVTTKILDSTSLPSDWTQVKADGSVVPLPGPTGNSGTVQYGYDAGRLAVRYAESCQPDDTALAAKVAAPLAGKKPLPMQLDLGGTALNQDQSPLGYVARASAEAANGQQKAAAADLRTSDELAQSTPTYYGSAWNALGALQLESRALGACSPLEGS